MTMHVSNRTATHKINAMIPNIGTLIHHSPGDALNGRRYMDEQEGAARACSIRMANGIKKKRISATQCQKDRLGSALIGYLSASPVNSFRYQGIMRKSCASTKI